MKKFLALVLIGIMVFSMTAWAGTDSEVNSVIFEESEAMNQAYELMDAEDYDAAVAVLREAADQGDMQAQYWLALMYYYGDGVEQDYEEAVKYLQMLADEGLVEAQYLLAVCYENGWGVDQDYDEAFEYYQTVADLGLPEAMFMLGMYYEDGSAVDQDLEMAAELYIEALAAGYEADEEDEEILTAILGEDHSEELIGLWEGHRIDEGSDVGHDHRWEFKEDGTYVYYDVKDGDKWVPVDELNAYIVLGNMLGTYWLKDGMETLKWWEFTIDGDTMNMTALSEDEEVKAATFEMKRIEE